MNENEIEITYSEELGGFDSSVGLDTNENSFEITSLDDYTKYVNNFAESGADMVLYRGQCNDDELLPGIGRKQEKDIFPKIPLDTEQKMLNDFKKKLPNFLQSEIKNEWDLLAVCQHHGLATRLLDWTQNPLIALWFACSSPYMNGNHSIIWAFTINVSSIFDFSKEGTSSPFDVESTKIISPNWVAKRIANQSGLFTIHKPKIEDNNLIFKVLNEDETFDPMPIKFIIPKIVRKDLIRQLNVYGVNHSSVFPDLDGLCKSLNYQYLDR
jgi:hypothetical protein